MIFGLLELARNPEFQDQLRAEIHATRAASPILVYDSMPLLNAFIKVYMGYILHELRDQLFR
jgi:cytochrome P450